MAPRFSTSSFSTCRLLSGPACCGPFRRLRCWQNKPSGKGKGKGPPAADPKRTSDPRARARPSTATDSRKRPPVAASTTATQRRRTQPSQQMPDASSAPTASTSTDPQKRVRTCAQHLKVPRPFTRLLHPCLCALSVTAVLLHVFLSSYSHFVCTPCVA